MMIWSTPKLIAKLGLELNLVSGLVLLTIYMILFSFTPTNNTNENNSYIFMTHVLPASIIITALGMSFSYIPVLITAVSNAKKKIQE
ncbi:MAG: hypothetical protein M3Z01_08420 [Thermoproteota archaeon]|nr:hypothetical protein [Thermoproteota archaeon]